MKSHHLLSAALLAASLAPPPLPAQDEPPIPLFTASTKSYGAFSEMLASISAAADPTGKQNPLQDFDDLLGDHPDALDRTRPAHLAVWLNGMFEPLVATFVPTGDPAALEELLAAGPGLDGLVIEPAGGYARILTGTEISLEQNLAAARAFDPATLKPDSAAKLTVRFDNPTRTMLKGILAMGRLQLMQQGAELGDEATAKMMRSVLALYFDIFDGLIDGMDESSISADITGDGVRFSLRSSAKPGSSYAALIAKSPMPPAPIAENYSHHAPVTIAGRIAEIGDPTLDALTKLATLGAGIGGELDPATLEKSMAMMKAMTPMYFSFDYDYEGELTAHGTYRFPGDKDVPALYKSWVDLAQEMGKAMSGDGKVYRKFKHQRVAGEGGTPVDRFLYNLGDDFPPNPMFGETMTMEYALSDDRILFAMGGKGVAPLLEPREPAPLHDFLIPTDTTVMIGHIDVLSIIGRFAQVEISQPAPLNPLTFIADTGTKGAKGTEKNAPGPADHDAKILMRASLDGSLTFDLHIPLTLIRTLSRMR